MKPLTIPAAKNQTIVRFMQSIDNFPADFEVSDQFWDDSNSYMERLIKEEMDQHYGDLIEPHSFWRIRVEDSVLTVTLYEVEGDDGTGIDLTVIVV